MALKCLSKFENYKINRGIDISSLVLEIESLIEEYSSASASKIGVNNIRIKVIHE